MITLTRFTNHDGPLTKQFALNQEGQLVKTAAAQLSRGRAETVCVSDLGELRELQRGLQRNQALAYGIFKDKPKEVSVATLRNAAEGDVTRSRNSMEWDQGPGILMLDIDPDGMPEAMRKRLERSPIDLVVQALPELKGATVLSVPSASTFIFQGEKCLKGKGGVHVYFVVDDARTIPVIGKILARRLWQRVYGFIKVARTGALLVRQLIDDSVFQPERLDFMASAICHDGLEQRRPNGSYVEGPILKAERIKPLSADEEAEYEKLVAEAKASIKDRAEQVREQYIGQQAKSLVDQGKVQDLDQARKVVRARITPNENGRFTLEPQDLLLFDDPKIGSKLVDEVLANPSAYQDKTLSDPHEPEEGRCKARLYVNTDGSVMVHSLAHGAGNLFVLRAADQPVSDDPLGWVYDHMITEQQAQDFDDPDFAYDGFIVNGHIIVIAGPANSGKTTIMLREVCPVMVNRGYRVLYINVDVASVDTREMVDQAAKDGIELLVPEVAGAGIENVIGNLEKMSIAQKTYSHTVIVLDTMKKFADLISKSETRKFLSMLRRLTGKGATVICLAHTNKRPDPNGKQIFEGVGDIKNDADELIYLVSEKQDDGTVLVSTVPDKTRARLTPLTFQIELDRSVTPAQRIDILDRQQRADQFAKDQDVIQAVTDMLANAECNQTQIINALHGQGISARQVRRVLQAYADPDAHVVLWAKTRDKKKNQTVYALKDQPAVCTPQWAGCANVKTVQSDQSGQGGQAVQTH